MSARHFWVLAVVIFGVSLQAEQEPGPLAVHVRLLTPVASYLQRGTPFAAKVMGTFDLASETEASSSLPAGSTVEGVIEEAKSIGIGFRHERASLQLMFTKCTRPDGTSSSCHFTLAAVDNARESVSKEGRIQGILAAAHPHSWLGGVWYRPGAALSRRSAGGLTGARGKLQSVLAPSALGVSLAIASRLVLFRLPDGEIELPAGTDLILHSHVARGPAERIPEAGPTGVELEPGLRAWLAGIPAGVTLPDGRAAADILNVAFAGTREQLDRAFASAGWDTADPLNAKTFARGYAAVSAMRTYRTAPVSPLHYEGRLPEAVFQKSFNSISKRHHIRLWQVAGAHGKVWIGAATHDVAVAFDWNRMSLTHKIDPNIDVERKKVLYDLTETGCIDASKAVARPEQARDAGKGDAISTDGVLGFTALRDCPKRVPFESLSRPKRLLTTVVARRFVLEGRHYFTRGNAYYWAYRGVRWTFSPKALRNAGARSPGRLERAAPSAGTKIVNSMSNTREDSTVVPAATRPLS